MKGLSNSAKQTVETVAKALLAHPVAKFGKNVPTSNPDYCEAFGVLRGAIATQGPRITRQIRIAPGHGQPTHDGIREWLNELIDEVSVVNMFQRRSSVVADFVTCSACQADLSEPKADAKQSGSSPDWLSSGFCSPECFDAQMRAQS